MAKMMAPANPTIVDIKVERGNAVIYATGMGMTGEGEGQIEFIRTNTNEWKLLNEAWNFK